MRRHVLIVEDDADIARLVALHLSDQNCSVDRAGTGEEGLRRLAAADYDLVILDLMLPGMDGLEVCRRIRAEQKSFVPILMLTAKSTELDRVVGLEVGADDYLTKPFSILELVARVKAIFRRVEALAAASADEEARVLELRGLRIDRERRRVTVEGREVKLTAKEFDLLVHFAAHPGRVFTRGQLLDQVWHYGHEGYEHTVNSHINRLRMKIEDDASEPRYIETVWGVGYRFRETDSASGD